MLIYQHRELLKLAAASEITHCMNGGRADGGMDGRMNGWRDTGRMGGWMDGGKEGLIGIKQCLAYNRSTEIFVE